MLSKNLSFQSVNISVKDDKLNPRVKKFVFLGVKKNMKCYNIWDPENRPVNESGSR